MELSGVAAVVMWPKADQMSEAEGNWFIGWLAIHDQFVLSQLDELVGQILFSSGESELGTSLTVFREKLSGEPPSE